MHPELESNELKSISKNNPNNSMQMTILLFGFVEMIIGFSGALLADFFSIFGVLTILSGVAGLTALIFCCLHLNKIKFYDLMGMAIVLGYGTGTLNSYLSHTLDGLNLFNLATVEEYWLSLTLGLTTGCAGFLHVFGRFHNTSPLIQNFELSADHKNRALLLLFLIMGLVMLAIATGQISLMGDTRINKGYVNVSPTATLISILVLPAGVLALYLALKEESKLLKFTLIFMAALSLLVMLGGGRRAFLVSIVIYLMFFFFSNESKKLLSPKSLLILVFIVILIKFLTTAFFVMRMASFSVQHTLSKTTIVELIPKTIGLYKDYDRLNIDDKVTENFSSRTFILDYLASILKGSSKYEILYGEDFIRAVTISTPGLLYPSKYISKYFTEEEVMFYKQYKSSKKDSAGSILTAGTGDFGVYGLFFYPLILSFFYSVLLKKLNQLFSPVKCLLISVTFFFNFLFLEQDITGSLLAIRNTPIILFILWLAFDFNSKKVSNYSSK
jgi:hypothetical protein